MEVQLVGGRYMKCTWLGAWKGQGGSWSPDLSKHTPKKAGWGHIQIQGEGASKGWDKV